MLKALVRAHLKALFSTMFARSLGGRGKRKRSALGTLGFALLMIYAFGCLVFAVGILCTQLLPLASAGLGWLYFALMGVSALLLCVFGGSFAAKSQIFEAKDNELLLSMPIPSGVILLSRLLPLFILNLVYGSLFLLPAGAVYFWQAGFAPLRALFFVLGALLLILLGTAVSALFGWLLSLLTARSRHKNLFTTLFSLLFLGGYFYLYGNLQHYLQSLLQNGASIAESIRRALPPAYHFGMAAAAGSGRSLALLALWSLIPTAAAFLLLRRSFLRIITTRRGAARIRYQAREMRAVSPLRALYLKETVRFFGTPAYLLNCGMGLIMMLGGAAVLAIKGPSLFASFTGGSARLLPAVLAGFLGFCAVMVDPSACSISLEGSIFYQLRAMPVRTRDLLGAKLLLPVSLGVPVCAVSCLLAGAALRLGPAFALALFAAGSALICWTAVFGLIVNLHLPRLDWINETVVIKQSMSMFIAIFAGMGFVAVPGILYGLLLPSLPFSAFLGGTAAVFLLLSFLGWRYLLARGERLLGRI